MKLESLRQVFLRPAPRLPKIIELACIIWAMRRKGLPEPEVEMLPEKLQRPDEHTYQLDCGPNGYRERGRASEPEVAIEDFGIEAASEIGDLVQLVRDHNVRDEYVRDDRGHPRVDGRGHKVRSTRNILNRHHGSIGFLTGSGWDVIYEVSARKWLGIVGQPNEETSGPLTPAHFLRMCLHVVSMHIDAEESRRTKGESVWGEGMDSRVIAQLLDLKFQGKPLRAGNFEFPTLSGYIRDLFQVGIRVADIRTMLRPWITLWRVLEACLEEAPSIQPSHTFPIGTGKGVIFDFLPVAGHEPPEGFDNPLVHQGWLSDAKDGKPRANVVIVRRMSGHVAIFCRGVQFDSVTCLATELKTWEKDNRWTSEQGGVIFNGSKSRPEVTPTGLPLYDEPDKSLETFCRRHLRLMTSQPIPAGKYAPREEVRSRS